MSGFAAKLRAADISCSLNRRGVVDPPDFIISEGIAALAPSTLRSRNWHLGQTLLVQYRKNPEFENVEKAFEHLRIGDEAYKKDNVTRTVLVKAWPLRSVPSDVVALDHSSLRALGIDHEKIGRRSISSLNGKQLSARKKKKKRARESVGSSGRARDPPSSRFSVTPKKPESTGSLLFGSGADSWETEGVLAEIRGLSPDSILDAESVLFAVENKQMQSVVKSRTVEPLLRRILLGRVLTSDMLVDVTVLGVVLSMRVKSLRCKGPEHGVYGVISNMTRLAVLNKADCRDEVEDSKDLRANSSALEDIGGLDREVKLIQKLLSISFDTKGCDYASCPRGLLLHGPTGSGKTLVAEAVANVSGVEAELVKGPEIISPLLGESESALSAIFRRAYSKAPCVIVLDGVDAIATRRDSPMASGAQQRLTSTLLTLMDGVVARKGPIFVIGTTNNIDTLDPAVRRPGRFDREIEIPVPNAQARADILYRMSSAARRQGAVAFTDAEMRCVANNAYGFVGADLDALWREAVLQALACEEDKGMHITVENLQKAVSKINPSALREVAIEIPSVRWDDIGGKEEVKQRLKEAVEWPLSAKGGAMFKAIGIRPPRGVLLFGPPGCSKTLLAKAVATESGANFISIKGPELLSKYVGESEKAVRAIFRRARTASPCVIFFDEIDALATSRSSPNTSSAESRVLAQLLTELDGIDTPLSVHSEDHVVVIAATNRPDLLDSALLRPGRMDRLLYIGLPDRAERLSILTVCCRDVPISACVDLKQIAKWSLVKGMSGAELAALVREASLAAMEEDVEHADCVRAKHFETAAAKVRKGTGPGMLQFYRQYMQNVRGVLLDECDWKNDSDPDQ